MGIRGNVLVKDATSRKAADLRPDDVNEFHQCT
jgi:hypothetical protein